jgi:prepilin-type processing-associated H-X9-DG protein
MNRTKLLSIVLFCALAAIVHAKDTADQIKCIKQLRELASLSITYAGSHDRLPETFEELLSFQKVPDRSILIAPSARNKDKPSYELLLPGERLNRIVDPARTIFIRSLYTLPDGRRPVAYADGHVEILNAQP